MRKNIACYLSSHGFGHAVRSETVIRALALARPDWNFFICSGSPDFLFRTVLQMPNVHLRHQATDFGLVQHDPRRFSLEETAVRLEELLAEYGRIVEREMTFLKRERITGIYCDLPYLPFLAAEKLDIPAAGMGNFSWDWVYYYYADHDPVFTRAAGLAARCYKSCALYLALPSSPATHAFPYVEHIPLVCRKAALSGPQLREELGIGAEEKAVLVGFSALELEEKARRRLGRLKGVRFLLPEPLTLDLPGGIQVPLATASFHSLVAACDVIVSKAGYGIVSDAIAAGKPLITTERGDFPEVPWLDRLLDETVGRTFLSRKRFEAGRWQQAIRLSRALPVTIPLNGTETAARRLVQFFRTHG